MKGAEIAAKMGLSPSAPPTLRESQRYCRRLARRHYENFTVASRLLPGRLRQHVCNLYAYCRWADDLADEVGDAGRSLDLLDWWESQLHDCFGGRATHPVFIALAETIRQYQLPAEPFLDLLAAFRQDQRIARYETTEAILDYCRHSANPVGRLVLHLGECCTPERAAWSDSICTGLQLTNFCQDVARDWDRGRIYLPLTACRQFGYEEAMFAGRTCNEAFGRLLAAQVDQAEGWLRGGMPLVASLPAGLRLAVALFLQGGLATLKVIRRQNYDVWTRRPTLSKFDKGRLLAGWWWKLRQS